MTTAAPTALKPLSDVPMPDDSDETTEHDLSVWHAAQALRWQKKADELSPVHTSGLADAKLGYRIARGAGWHDAISRLCLHAELAFVYDTRFEPLDAAFMAIEGDDVAEWITQIVTEAGYDWETAQPIDNHIWQDVALERARAHAKHGATSVESQGIGSPYRLAILVEEVGEVARHINDSRHTGEAVVAEDLRDELIQVAAMAGAWADKINEHIAEVKAAEPTCLTASA